MNNTQWKTVPREASESEVKSRKQNHKGNCFTARACKGGGGEIRNAHTPPQSGINLNLSAEDLESEWTTLCIDEGKKL